jgi:hypothetical protein
MSNEQSTSLEFEYREFTFRKTAILAEICRGFSQLLKAKTADG